MGSSRVPFAGDAGQLPCTAIVQKYTYPVATNRTPRVPRSPEISKPGAFVPSCLSDGALHAVCGGRRPVSVCQSFRSNWLRSRLAIARFLATVLVRLRHVPCDLAFDEPSCGNLQPDLCLKLSWITASDRPIEKVHALLPSPPMVCIEGVHHRFRSCPDVIRAGQIGFESESGFG
jgi:hypothetical protein